MKNALRVSLLPVLLSVLAFGVSVPSALANSTSVLGVTQITAVQTYATAGGGYAEGWKWVFDVTVPSDQTILQMKFDDWTNALGYIPAAGNIQFYSAQSLNATNEDQAIGITASSTLSSPMYLNPNEDLDVNQGGRQIQITVEAQVPEGAAGGSYSTSYGITTNPPAPATITVGNLTQTYDSTAKSVTVTTNPAGLANSVTYNGSSLMPINAGPYTILATVTDPNYTGTQTASMVINPAAVTVSANPQTKVFGAADPTLTYTNPSLFDSDTFSGALTRDAGEQVGTYNITQGTLALDGNYSLTFVPSTFTITKAPVTVTWTNPSDIVYDTALDGTQLDATASVPGTFVYTPAAGTILDAGANQTLSVTFTPTDSVDYASVTQTAQINVTQSTSTTIVTCPDSVTYNASAQTPCTVLVTGNGGLNLTPSNAIVYTSNTNAGTATASYTYAGDNNHSGSSDSKTFDITPGTVSVTASNGTMTYGGTVPTITAIYNPVIVPATSATCSTAATGSSPVGSYTSSCSGAADPNYTFTIYTNGSVNVTPATANITVTPYSVTYDGNPHTATVVATGVKGEDLSADVVLTGTTHIDAGNYANDSWTFHDATGNYKDTNGTVNDTINAIATTVTASGIDKVYNDNTTATANLSVSGAINGDKLTANYASATFDGKDVGSHSVIVTGITLSGTNAGNYTVNPTATTNANITPMALTVTAAAPNKVYDGNTSVGTVTLSTNAYADDGITATGANNGYFFTDRNVGNGKAVHVVGITVSGPGLSNYTLNGTNGSLSVSTTADITALPLTIAGLSASNKMYDGTTVATITGTPSLIGIQNDPDTNALDIVSLTGTPIGTFADDSVGTGKTVTVSGLSLTGADSDNYTLTATTTTADITPAPNPITGTATNITSTDATLNGTNGPADATGHSFWVSTAAFSTASPTVPSGVYSTADLGSITAGASFSAQLSSVSGLLPTADTTYYFVAWSNVGGTWYPGTVQTFTTLAIEPTITTSNLPSTITVGTAAAEDSNGVVTGFTPTGTPVSVSLTKGSVDYPNVRVVVTGLNSGIQLLATDGTNWYDIIKTGWGPAGGFPLADATTPVYLVANTAGTYTATIDLVDVTNSNAVLASTIVSVTAN